MRPALRRLHQRVAAEPERGTTLMELVVGMIIMTICGSIFTGAMVSLTRISNQTQAITDATSQNNRAYQALERTVRYAAAISEPGQSTGSPKSWYVELSDTTSGKEVCTQLRVDVATQQLQSRTWQTTPLTAATAWTPVSSGIANGADTGDTRPFYLVKQSTTATPTPSGLPAQGATANRQRLRFYLTSTSGPPNGRSSSTSSFVLTAANSTVPVDAGPICNQVTRP